MNKEVKEIIKNITTQKELNITHSFDIAKKVGILLRDKNNEIFGREILIHALDNWNKINKETIEMWTDLVESAGFYPYLEKNKESMRFNNTPGKIRKEYCGSVNLKSQYFHIEQKQLEEILVKKKNLIVSAPTSFGKSMLIEEVVASMIYNNIVVIQPTLALLDETRKKLKKYNNNYKIILRTSQNPSMEKRNIFLLTAERVMEYKHFGRYPFS